MSDPLNTLGLVSWGFLGEEGGGETIIIHEPPIVIQQTPLSSLRMAKLKIVPYDPSQLRATLLMKLGNISLPSNIEPSLYNRLKKGRP